jgi:hypothetical protein
MFQADQPFQGFRPHPVVPGQSRCQHFVVQHPSVLQDRPANQHFVRVDPLHFQAHRLFQGHFFQESPGLGTERLPAFRRVDIHQPRLEQFAFDLHRQRIAAVNGDHPAGEFVVLALRGKQQG